MKLNVTPEIDNKFTDNVFNLTTAALKFKATHLFIAGNKWEEIRITINPDYDAEDVSFLHLVCDNIIAVVTHTLNENDINKLCALYPESAGSIRMTFMQKGNMQKVLPNVEYTEVSY